MGRTVQRRLTCFGNYAYVAWDRGWWCWMFPTQQTPEPYGRGEPFGGVGSRRASAAALPT